MRNIFLKWIFLIIGSLSLVSCYEFPFPTYPNCSGGIVLLQERVIPFIPYPVSDLSFRSETGIQSLLQIEMELDYLKVGGGDCSSRRELLLLNYKFKDSTLFAVQFQVWITFSLDYPELIDGTRNERVIGNLYFSDGESNPSPLEGWRMYNVDTLDKTMIVFELLPWALNSNNKLKQLKFLEGFGPVEFIDGQNLKWRVVN